MINYRYNIVGKLGEGGAGEVFLVEDTLSGGQPLALKALWLSGHPGAVDEEQFLSEVSLLLRLIHPNVIRMYDFGVIRKAEDESLERRRYYTMEYVEGTDMLAWCSKVAEPHKKASILESLVAQALSVLSYIHGEGVLHFDIKPQNFMLLPPKGDATFPTVKLTDFGFSRKVEATEKLPLRGTLEYTAPELLRGEPANQRIDLYSLGAMLFQLLEGHCPFEAANPVDLVKLTLTQRPYFVQAQNPEFERLRKVAACLLEKEPAYRYSTAREAARELLADRPEVWKQYLGFALRPRFVGRRDQQEVIGRGLAALRANDKSAKTTAIVLKGGEGIGKSALLREMERRARSDGLTVYELSSAQGAVPFGALEPVLMMLQAQARSFSSEGERIVQRHSSVLTLKGDWVRDREAVVELRARFVDECTALFPLLLLADDLHLMDEFSLQVLNTLARGAHPGRFLLLATEPTESAERLDTPRMVEVRLSELSKEEIGEMASSLLGQGLLGDGLGQRVFEMFGGAPELAVEAMRVAMDRLPDNTVTDEAAAQGFLRSLDSYLPANLDDMVIRKIERLDSSKQRVLSYLSCFSNPARVDIVLGLFPGSRQRSLQDLAILEVGGYLQRTARHGRVEIKATTLKAALYKSLGSGCSALHQEISAAMVGQHDPASLEDLSELTFQFRQGGNNQKAAQYGEAAADVAFRLSAFQRSVELFRDAIMLAGGRGERGKILGVKTKLVEALLAAGEYQQAIDLADELLAADRVGGQMSSPQDQHIVKLQKLVGRAHAELGDFDSARKNMAAALAQVQDETEQLELRQELAGVDIALGDYAGAEQLCREQIERAKKLRNNPLLAAAYTDLGIVTFHQGKFDDAIQSFNNSIGVFTETKESARLAGVMTNLGNVMSAKGDLTMAIEYWRSALQKSREYGTVNQQARILNNLGIAHFNLKVYDKAKEFYGQARQLFDRINSKSGLAYTLTNFGEVYLAEGEYEAALDNWNAARELYAAMEDSHGLTETYLQLAQVYLMLEDRDLADEVLSEAEKLISEKKLDLFSGQLLYVKGLYLIAERTWDAALEALSASEKWYDEAGQAEKKWTSRVNIARCHLLRESPQEAVQVLEELLGGKQQPLSPQIEAEASYLMGELGKVAPTLVADKPLNYYKRGMQLIEKEPVTELTWKIAFALAREYHERGQNDRAAEFLLKTKAIVEYFLSNFRSNDLRNQYLLVDQKNRVLSTIEILTKR